MEPCLPPYDCSSWRRSFAEPSSAEMVFKQCMPSFVTHDVQELFESSLSCGKRKRGPQGNQLSYEVHAEANSRKHTAVCTTGYALTAMCGSTESGSRRRKGRHGGTDPPVSNAGRKHVLDQTEGQEVCECSSGCRNRERASQQNQISSQVHPESNADRVVATNGVAPDSLDTEPTPATFGPSETQKRGCTQSSPRRGKRGPTHSGSGAQPSQLFTAYVCQGRLC
ncbi:hypothetical protein Tco_0151609 [Tanacetum coccineum]